MENYPGREMAIGRITAARVCDYRKEWQEYGSNHWLIEQIQKFKPLEECSDEYLNVYYQTEVAPTNNYPWDEPDLCVTQHEFLGTLNGINTEDPWLEAFKDIWVEQNSTEQE
jgi:hypothetical protein